MHAWLNGTDRWMDVYGEQETGVSALQTCEWKSLFATRYTVQCKRKNDDGTPSTSSNSSEPKCEENKTNTSKKETRWRSLTMNRKMRSLTHAYCVCVCECVKKKDDFTDFDIIFILPPYRTVPRLTVSSILPG